MPQAVRFDNYGDIDVLEVRDVPRPSPAAGEVLVRVRAAGINPGENVIRIGALHDRWPATFPSGQGSDLAGVVEEAGSGVANWSIGDEVIGWVDTRASHAELVVVPAGHLVPRDPAVPWEAGGSLFVAGTTAHANVRAAGAGPGDTVVVAGAAGGVGALTIQLLRHAGATVIGLAGVANHAWLREHGVLPVAYGDGVLDRIREAAPEGVDAFVDNFGDGYIDLALELGVASNRRDTDQALPPRSHDMPSLHGTHRPRPVIAHLTAPTAHRRAVPADDRTTATDQADGRPGLDHQRDRLGTRSRPQNRPSLCSQLRRRAQDRGCPSAGCGPGSPGGGVSSSIGSGCDRAEVETCPVDASVSGCHDHWSTHDGLGAVRRKRRDELPGQAVRVAALDLHLAAFYNKTLLAKPAERADHDLADECSPAGGQPGDVKGVSATSLTRNGVVSRLIITLFGIRCPSGEVNSDGAGVSDTRNRNRRWRGKRDLAQGIGKDRVDPDADVDAQDPQLAEDWAFC